MRTLYLETYSVWKSVAQNGLTVYEKLLEGNRRQAWVGTVDYLYTVNIDDSTYTDYNTTFPTRTAVASEDEAIALVLNYALYKERQEDGAMKVAIVGRVGDEVVTASHNLTDKTSWYSTSTRVTDEVATDSGDGLTWNLANTYVIDTTHGKLLDEENKVHVLQAHKYLVEVKVDDVVVNARPAFATDWSGGGDYYCDYVNGDIVFQTTKAGSVVKVSYSYAVDSKWILDPDPGKVLTIEGAEAQFSKDVVFDDGIVFEVQGYVDVFAPHLLDTADPPGPYPSGTRIPLRNTAYKTMTQLTAEAVGAYPVVPAVSSNNGRGNPSEVYGFPFNYATKTDLMHSAGMRLVLSLSNDQALGGTLVTTTFYCISNDE